MLVNIGVKIFGSINIKYIIFWGHHVAYEHSVLLKFNLYKKYLAKLASL